MIKAEATLTIRRIGIRELHVHETQVRYPPMLMRYIELLSANPEDDPGLLLVKPCKVGGYEILDGHHRFCALIMTGRKNALCVVIEEWE